MWNHNTSWKIKIILIHFHSSLVPPPQNDCLKCSELLLHLTFKFQSKFNQERLKLKNQQKNLELFVLLPRCLPANLSLCMSPELPICISDWEDKQLLFQLPAWWRRQRPLKVDPRVHVMIVGLAWDFSNWKVDSSSLGYGRWGIKQQKALGMAFTVVISIQI